jgi:transcriptional regulator
MEMFATQGIKAVRMDDIARSLGVSKRTLYEQFGDKQGLLLLAMNRYFERMQQRYAEMTASARNVLEEMFMVLGEVMASSEVTNRMAANLKKFYPEVHDKLTEAYLCKRTEELRLRLEKGIADGLFVRDINIELAISVLYYTASALVVRRDLIIPKGMSEREAFVQIVSNFFRGISTARGLELIDDYLTRYHLSSNNEENKEI